MMVDLAPIAASGPHPPEPISPGPASSEAADSAAATPAEQGKPPAEDTVDLAKSVEAPPELTLPERTELPLQEPLPETQVEQKQVTAASAGSVAAQAAAPPPLEAEVQAERATAPAQGMSLRDRQARTRWESAMSGHLARFARFPDGVRGQREERITSIRFRLDRQGRVVATEVATSSGSEALDAEAQAMLRRASPLPVPPEQVRGELVELVVPVRFKPRR
jgi:protein TonB